VCVCVCVCVCVSVKVSKVWFFYLFTQNTNLNDNIQRYVFMHVRRIAKNGFVMSVHLSVCPSVCEEQLGSHQTDFREK